MTSWEYIKKKRGWTVGSVIAGLEVRSWDSFQAFFSQRGIECPEKSEYDQVLKDKAHQAKVQQVPAPQKTKAPAPSVTKVTKSPSTTRATKSKKKIAKS